MLLLCLRICQHSWHILGLSKNVRERNKVWNHVSSWAFNLWADNVISFKAPHVEQRQATPVILCPFLVCPCFTKAFKNNASIFQCVGQRGEKQETSGVSEKQAGERFLSVGTQIGYLTVTWSRCFKVPSSRNTFCGPCFSM